MIFSLNVLVTRPQPVGEKLCQAIEVAGGKAFYFPVIDIVPTTETPLFKQVLAKLDQYDWLIFISPIAVLTGKIALLEKWPTLPSQLKVAAVGEGTAAALREANIPVTLCPTKNWSSEGLLDLPPMQSVKNQKIALFRGEDGRELLTKILTERGAVVSHLITYRRELPTVDTTDIQQRILSHEINIVVCTSGEGLSNLKKLLMPVWRELRQIPVIVISERMKLLARERGFEKIFLAKNASQDAIMQTISLFSQKGLDMTNVTTETTTTEKQRYFPWSGIGIFISILVLIALLVTAYLGEQRLMLVNANVANMHTDVSHQITQNQDNVTALQKNVGEMQQSVVALQQSVSELRSAAHNDKEAWTIAEAQYLTKLANDNLQIGDNLPLVIRLLQTADQEITPLSDPKIAPIRKALARDITSLQAIPVVDMTGIYLKLSALNTEVNKLPLPNNRPAGEATSTANDAMSPWWRRGLNESLKALHKIVVVRYNQSGQLPFIAPEQQQFLYQNVHAMFEQAMSAVIHKQPEIYRQSLQTAKEWIKQYFMQDSAVTIALLKSLDELQSVQIKPELPTLSETLQAFRDYLAENVNHSADATETSQST